MRESWSAALSSQGLRVTMLLEERTTYFSSCSHQEQQSIQRWLHTIICTRLDTILQQSTGIAISLVRFTSQFQIQAGVRLSGVNFTDSGCARLAYSYLTLIHSAQTRYLSSLRSTISQHSVHLQHCTESLSVWI